MKPKINIIAVGGLKEPALLGASEYYVNKLKRFCDVSIIESPDEPAPERMGAAECLAALSREGGRVLKNIGPQDIVVAMAVEGRRAGLPFFREIINEAAGQDRRLCFVVGGSLGLGGNVLRRAGHKISLSGLTFPHRLARLALMEAVCMAFEAANRE